MSAQTCDTRTRLIFHALLLPPVPALHGPVDSASALSLPTKPSGAMECLSFVVGAILYFVEVLQEVPTSC